MLDSKSILECIKEVEKNHDESFKAYGDYPIIFFIGGTGSGKSTVTASCLNKPIIIKMKDDGELVLEGEGISHREISETKISKPFISREHKLIFVDNPGFFDTNGPLDEIKNAYGIYYLFKKGNDSSKNSRFKIIFVIQDSEFTALRGKSVKEDHERLKKMFGRADAFKDGVGIVITKARRRIKYS